MYVYIYIYIYTYAYMCIYIYIYIYISEDALQEAGLLQQEPLHGWTEEARLLPGRQAEACPKNYYYYYYYYYY